MMRWRPGWALLALLPLGCARGCGAPPPEAGKDFGALGEPAPTDAMMDALLGAARDVVERRAPRAWPGSSGRSGRRVFLMLWPTARPGADEAIVASANAATLDGSVQRAAEAIASRVPAGGGRLELDVTVSISGPPLGDLDTSLPSLGLEGVAVVRDDGRAGFVLPGEIVERGLFREGKAPLLDRDRIGRLLAGRAGVSESELASMRAYRFGTESRIESADGAHTLRVVRGFVERSARVDPLRLLEAVRRGADYLVRILGDQGRYVYRYHPVDDRNDTSYGWLRHAGTTYALFEAYEEFGTAAYRESGERALGALKRKLTEVPGSHGDKVLIDTNDEEEQKTGGAGLALLAFTKHAAVTGDRSEIETMRALARAILAAQYADGHFRSNADVARETGKTLKREPIYYTGEATLGLLRLFALDPQPSYVEAARRAADWVIQKRDAFVSEDKQEHDHWMAYALNDLYRVTSEPSYLAHAFKIARAILRAQRRAGEAPAADWVGGFFEGQSTPAATRVEALDAVMAVSRFVGKAEDWLVEPTKAAAGFVAAQQFDADDGYWLKNPPAAAGGVRESLYAADVQIDYVQHAMSAWLHLARCLRDPAYGKTGVPSQDPVREATGP